MDFLNTAMLWGLAAGSIPLIIHLLNRRRHRVVHWGAMRFLRISYVTRHRRIRIEELILLLLRTLLIMVLVAAMARPFLTSRMFSSAKNHKDLVILLDSSFSMALKDRGASIFDRAREEAEKAVDTLSTGDSVSVILASRTPRPLLSEPSYDFEKVRKALARSHESLSSLDIPRSLDRAFAFLKKGANPVAEILIITDGQRHGWFTGEVNRWKYVAEQLAESKRKPRIYVLTIPRRGTVANLGLGELTLRRTVVGTDRDVRITVNVRNTGEVALGPQRLSFAVDGKQPVPVTVERLLPGTSAPVSFSHRFDTPGSHYVAANLEQDLLPPDDRVYLGLEVLDTLPVLLVDGSSSPDPMKRETLFLASALEPTPKYVVRPTVIAPAALAATDLGAFAAVVLVDVGQLSSEDTTKLEDFVRSGGGLLIVPGEQVKPQIYSTTLWRGGEGLLPAEMLKLEGDAVKRDKPLGIHLSGLTHETMQLLADAEKSDLNQALVYRYVKLAAPAGGAGASVVLRLANGDPLLVEKDFGRGRVMVTACSLDTSWSNLPVCTSYVVLVHELIYYLSSPLLPARNIPAGEPLVVKLDEQTPADEVELLLPMGGLKKLPIERRQGRRTATYLDTTEAGLYEASYRARRGLVKEYYVVNFEPAESDLTLLGSSSREIVSSQTGAKFFADWASLEGALRVGYSIREIWRWLAVLTVVLLVVEVVLTQRFSRRKAAGVEGVQFGTG